MKLKELIANLSKLDQELEVMVRYVDDFDDENTDYVTHISDICHHDNKEIIFGVA
jgi:hypothetical protein